MATEVGSAFVTLIPSLRGFSARAASELNRSGLSERLSAELTSGATRAGNRAGGLFSRSFARSSRSVNFPGPSASLLRNIRTYGYAVSGVATLTAGLGLKTESAMEQSKVAFTTMLGSARRAKTFLAGLTRFAQTTPFDLPGVVTASQKLLAFGFTAKQTLPTLTALGDAAAGLSLGADGLDRLTTAVGQIQAKGKVQSDELLQLTESGVPALKILANSFGVTTAAMQDMVTKGLVPADKAIPALLQGLEQGTNGIAGQTAKFGGLMEKQSHTLGGIISNLRDTVSQGLGRAVKPLAKVLERDLPKAMKRLPDVFDAIGRGVRRALPVLTDFAGKARAVFVQATPTVKEFLTSAVDLGRALKPTVTQFARLAGGAILGGLKALSAVMRFLADHSTLLRAAVDLLIARVVVLKTQSYLAAGGMTRMGTVAGRLSGAAGPLAALAVAADTAYSTVRNQNAKAAESFRRLAVAGGSDLGDLEGKWLQLSQVVQQQTGLQKAATGALVTAMRTGLENAGVALDTIGAKFVATANRMIAVGQQVAHFFSTALGDATQPNINYKLDPGHPGAYVAPSLKKASNKAKQDALPTFSLDGLDLGSATGDGIAKGVKDSTPKVSTAMTGLVDKIMTPLRDLLSKARSFASQITDAITGSTGFGGITQQTDSLGATFTASVSQLIGSLSEQRKAVRQFRKELRLLDKRGLSDAAINEIAGLGLDQGGGLADTLMGATRKQLRRISRLRFGTNRAARGIGTDRAADRFGGQIAREVRRTTHAVEKAAQNTELGPKTMRGLRHELRHLERRSGRYLDTVKLDKKQGREVLVG